MLGCVRTTIRLDDDLLAAARLRAAERGTTLTSVIEEALREALARRPAPEAEPFQLVTYYGKGGTLPGVDLHDNVALRDLMDEG